MRRLNFSAFMVLFAGLVVATESFAGQYERIDNSAAAEAEMCRDVGCQFNVRVVLKKEDGSLYDNTFGAMPVVQENGASVYAGQTVHFEADVSGDELINLKLVPSIADPKRTITATLKQNDDGAMMLALSNPFDRDIRISMGIMPLDQERLVKTSSCPVKATGGGYEMWPYPIFQVWLGNLHFLKTGETTDCVE